MKKPEYSTAIIHQFDPESPAPGGIDTCIRDMLKFVPEGERVLVIGVSETRRLNHVIRIETFPTPFDFLPVSRADPRNQSRVIPHSIRLLFGLMRALLVHRVKAAVVHIHRLEPGVLVSGLAPKRIAYFVHTNVEQTLSSNSDSFWRRAPKFYARLEQWVLDRADIVPVFNQLTADAYAARGFSVERMRTWYDENIYYLPAPRDRTVPRTSVLLWVGRIEAPKDPLLALDVFRALHEQTNGSWRFAIVGDGTMRAVLEERVREWGLGQAVHFFGGVSRKEVGQHMRDADVLLMTSHFEGSPLVLYEGMGSGLPVVAVREADPDGVIVSGENGSKVDQREAMQFVQAIVDASLLVRENVARTVESRRASAVVPQLWRLTNDPRG